MYSARATGPTSQNRRSKPARAKYEERFLAPQTPLGMTVWESEPREEELASVGTAERREESGGNGSQSEIGVPGGRRRFFARWLGVRGMGWPRATRIVRWHGRRHFHHSSGFRASHKSSVRGRCCPSPRERLQKSAFRGRCDYRRWP